MLGAPVGTSCKKHCDTPLVMKCARSFVLLQRMIRDRKNVQGLLTVSISILVFFSDSSCAPENVYNIIRLHVCSSCTPFPPIVSVMLDSRVVQTALVCVIYLD